MRQELQQQSLCETRTKEKKPHTEAEGLYHEEATIYKAKESTQTKGRLASNTDIGENTRQVPDSL